MRTFFFLNRDNIFTFMFFDFTVFYQLQTKVEFLHFRLYSSMFILLAFSAVAFRRIDTEGTRESSLLTNSSSLGKKALVENAR